MQRVSIAAHTGVKGLPGLLVLRAEGLERTIAFEVSPERRIRAIYMVLNPDKLRNPGAPPRGGAEFTWNASVGNHGVTDGEVE